MTPFADPRLELAVRAAMPQDVLAQPLDSLPHLDASELGIRRLHGIGQLRELRWLDLSRNPVASVAELGANTKLIRLRLAHAGMSTLAGLGGLPELEDLDLYASRVITIDDIAGLPALRSLDLSLCLVKNIAPLASLAKLESLSLGNPSLHIPRRSVFAAPDPVTLNLSVLRSLGQLRQLRAYGLRLSSATILSELVGLEELVLERCSIDDDLRAFPRLPRLEHLSLAGCKVGALEPVAQLPRLRELNLDDATIRDVHALRGCGSLEILSLRETSISERSSVRSLRQLPHLTQLRLGNRLVQS